MLRAATFFVLLNILAFPAPANSGGKNLDRLIQPEAMREDIDQWLKFLDATHPQLSYTVEDTEAFYRDVDALQAGIGEPLTVREFWVRLSAFNKRLSDGHMGIAFGGWEPVITGHLDSGGTLFPFEVAFDKEALLVKNSLGGNSSEYRGYRIEKINGLEIREIVDRLLNHVNGDSRRQRKAILERRFAALHFLVYGDSSRYRVEVAKGARKKVVEVVGGRNKPEYVKDESFEDLYRFEILDGENALLTINRFIWDDPDIYFAFMQSSFKAVKEKDIRHLVIDIRANGGGNDDMWMLGILDYIADRPYRWGSKYQKKIIEKYMDEGETLGDVITGEIEKRIEPNLDNPYRFDGEVSILIGPYTYSSSILFSNTVQDYGFATLVGTATGGKSGQSGGVQSEVLFHSKLEVFSPRFYLERPKGGGNLLPVQPDIEIGYYPLDTMDLVRKIIARRADSAATSARRNRFLGRVGESDRGQ